MALEISLHAGRKDGVPLRLSFEGRHGQHGSDRGRIWRYKKSGRWGREGSRAKGTSVVCMRVRTAEEKGQRETLL